MPQEEAKLICGVQTWDLGLNKELVWWWEVYHSSLSQFWFCEGFERSHYWLSSGGNCFPWEDCSCFRVQSHQYR
jgi:hypothetical protein